jgi:hypothetical protein
MGRYDIALGKGPQIEPAPEPKIEPSPDRSAHEKGFRMRKAPQHEGTPTVEISTIGEEDYLELRL